MQLPLGKGISPAAKLLLLLDAVRMALLGFALFWMNAFESMSCTKPWSLVREDRDLEQTDGSDRGMPMGYIG